MTLPSSSSLDLSRLMQRGMAVLPIFEEMQRNGMPVHRPHFVALRNRLEQDLDSLQSAISSRFYGGRPFNPKSPDHVNSLRRRRGLTDGKRTKKGRMSTSKKSIEHYRFKDEAIGLVFDWRERQHLRDMYCNDILSRIPEDAEYYTIHPALMTTRVHTRRLASNNPNLLAVPIRTELGRQIREGYRFPPTTEEVFGAWDLSQIEMRVLASESQSNFLCDAFINGRDIHTETAMMVFDLPADRIDDMEHRLPAKTTNFSMVYGVQGQGLSDQLRALGLEGWGKERCEGMRKQIIKLFGIGPYINKVEREARECGHVRSYLGMYRYLPHLLSANPKLSSEAGRQAVAHRISGTAQDMIQNAMICMNHKINQLRESGYHIKWRLQIHDEVILSFPVWLWDVIDPIIMDALTNHCGVPLTVPIKAKGHMSKSWGGLK